MAWLLGSYGFWVGLGLPPLLLWLWLSHPATHVVWKPVGVGFVLGLAAGLAGVGAGLLLLHWYGRGS